MEKYQRRNYFIDRSFQSAFIIKFCLIVLISSVLVAVILFVLSRDFTTVAIENAHVIVKSTSSFLAPIIIQTLSLVTFFTAIAVIILTMFVSHKIAGPLFRIKREIYDIRDGKLNRSFKIRKSDQLKDLAESLADMSKAITEKHVQLKARFDEMKHCYTRADADQSAVVKKIEEVEQIIKYFKI